MKWIFKSDRSSFVLKGLIRPFKGIIVKPTFQKLRLVGQKGDIRLFILCLLSINSNESPTLWWLLLVRTGNGHTFDSVRNIWLLGTSASNCSELLSVFIAQYDVICQTSHTSFTNAAFAAQSSCNKTVKSLSYFTEPQHPHCRQLCYSREFSVSY